MDGDRTVAAMAAPIDTTVSLAALPTELIEFILVKVDKSDLKSLRLMCCRLRDIAESFLFDKLIISPHEGNLVSFLGIVENPRLTRHVRTVTYDVQLFRPSKYFELKYYIACLVRQLNQDVRRLDPSTIPKELQRALESVRYFQDPGDTRTRVAMLTLIGGALMKGYKAYVDAASSQEAVVATGQVYRHICKALLKCPKVVHFVFQTKWSPFEQSPKKSLESLVPYYPSSGPLARSWSPLYLRPTVLPEAQIRRVRIFTAVFQALKQSKRRVPCLSFAGFPGSFVLFNSLCSA